MTSLTARMLVVELVSSLADEHGVGLFFDGIVESSRRRCHEMVEAVMMDSARVLFLE